MLFCFTNRRRAKDTIMLIADTYGTEGITVFVREGLVYVEASKDSIPEIALVMHYAELCKGGIEDFLRLEDVEELYKDEGICKFRV